MKPRADLLQKYHLVPQELGECPLDWGNVFSREAPLFVEIGFGGGEYLAWHASQHPEFNCIGIELPPDCLAHATVRLAERQVEYARLIQGDARYLLRELFRSQSVRHVLMQFPMPWPKDKHAKHRVYGALFAASLLDVLEPDGVFELVTDQVWYAHETVAALTQDGRFSCTPVEVDPVRPFRTRYESKWLDEGRHIYRTTAQALQHEIAQRFHLKQPMQVAKLHQMPSAEEVQVLLGQRLSGAGWLCEVKDIYQASNGWLLGVVTSDDNFSQRFHLEITSKKDGRVLIKVAQVPRPYYTTAVREAVVAIGRLLEAGDQ